MASAKPKPRKRLAEFLKEQQEPFILDLYLLEKGYSTSGESRKSLERCNINKKKEPLFQFSRLLTTLHKKLVFHNKRCVVIRDSNIIEEHVNVSVPREVDQTVEDLDRFSFSTVYLSCSDTDEDGTSFSPHKDKAFFSPNTFQASNIRVLQSQQATDNEEHHQIRLEGSSVPESRNVSVTHAILNQDVPRMEERMNSCCVFVPKKIMTEDSLLPVALWSSLIQSGKRQKCKKELQEFLGENREVCHVLKSKTLLHKAKQLLFYCVRDISSINHSRKDCGQQNCLKQIRRRPEEMEKIIWERTRKLGKVVGNETNLITEMHEWSEFKPQAMHICVEVAEAVLERVTYEIVVEMIQVK